MCEVGVYEPETSNILDFIRCNIKTTLVEANPDLSKRIAGYFREYSVQVYPVAVWDYTGTLLLAKAKASTFVLDLASTPALINDHYQVDPTNTFQIECIPFSAIDDGAIDLISIDVEGSEWYVLKHMRSRPKVISIETHGKNYINPFLANITQWMEQNSYQVWYKDNTDSVYIQQGLFELTWLDHFRLRYKNLRITLRKRKGAFLQRLSIG